MAAISFLFFVAVLAAAIWAIYATVAPRGRYITALLSDSAAAPVLVPTVRGRPVRRVSPLSPRAELRLIRAAA